MDQAFLYLVLWVALFAGIFTILIKKKWLSGGAKTLGPRGSLDKSFIKIKWQEIEELLDQSKPSAYKVAIIEADKLVDYVLKAKVGVNGNMGDRIKKSQKLFSNYSDYQNLWEAHKMRNRITHEADHELFLAEVKKNISYFKKALQKLRAL